MEAQLENWLRETLESNDELAEALELLRGSYWVLLSGKPVKDSDEILARVEVALKNAAKAKNVA